MSSCQWSPGRHLFVFQMLGQLATWRPPLGLGIVCILGSRSVLKAE